MITAKTREVWCDYYRDSRKVELTLTCEGCGTSWTGYFYTSYVPDSTLPCVALAAHVHACEGT